MSMFVIDEIYTLNLQHVLSRSDLDPISVLDEIRSNKTVAEEILGFIDQGCNYARYIKGDIERAEIPDEDSGAFIPIEHVSREALNLLGVEFQLGQVRDVLVETRAALTARAQEKHASLDEMLGT